MNENQNPSSVPHGTPDKQIPTSDHAMMLRLGIILVLHLILGIACFALLGFGFLLLETGDWFFFWSFGAASCAVGVAASGLSAYFSALDDVMDPLLYILALLFALPVLLVGTLGMIDLITAPSPRVRLPLIVFFAFGVAMFVASSAGGLVGAVCGKKRHPKKTAERSLNFTALAVPLAVAGLFQLATGAQRLHGQVSQEQIGEGERQ